MWLGGRLAGKRFDPFGVGGDFVAALVRGFHLRLMVLIPFGEPGQNDIDPLRGSRAKGQCPLRRTGLRSFQGQE